MSLEIVHADNHLLVVVKPAGVPCVPDPSGDRSLLDMAKAWVAETYSKPGAVFLGVVQRLDRPVSGLVVFARTSKAADRLTRAFRERAVEKIYWGIGEGRVQRGEGRLEQWLVKDRARNTVSVRGEGTRDAKLAVTDWRTTSGAASGAPGRTGFVLRPRTGRPHQLRVVCASLGGVLLGDVRYGAQEPLPDKSIALHARALRFAHPTRDEELHLVLEPPSTPWWQAWRPALEAAG